MVKMRLIFLIYNESLVTPNDFLDSFKQIIYLT